MEHPKYVRHSCINYGGVFWGHSDFPTAKLHIHTALGYSMSVIPETREVNFKAKDNVCIIDLPFRDKLSLTLTQIQEILPTLLPLKE